MSSRPPAAPETTLATAPGTIQAAASQELGWWMPLFLFLGGWIVYFFRNDNTGFEIGTVVGTLVVCRSVYLLIFKCQDVRFTWITSCGLLLGYALGSFNTAAQLARKEQTLAEHFSRPQDDLSVGLALVLWVSATLFLGGSFLEKPIRLNFARLLRTDIAYVALAFLIYIGALATHQIGYGGSSVSDAGHVTIFGTVAGLVGPTLPAMTVILRRKSKLLSRTLPFWGLLIAELAMQVPSGRRIVIYSVLCVVFAFTLAGDRWKGALWKKAAIVAGCLIGLYCANVAFYAMRHQVEIAGAGGRVGATSMDTGEMVSRALKFIAEGRDSNFDEEMAGNLQDRTFVLKYFSELAAQSRTHSPLHGKLLLFTVSMATPSAIYSIFGNKDAVIALGMEEMVANPDFGLKAQDEANSLVTAGVSDFGVAGVFVYPMAMALLINFLIRVGLGRAPELMRFLAVMMFVWVLFQTEMGITGIVVGIRNGALMLMCWFPVSMAARFFMKPPNKARNRLDRKRAPAVVLVRYAVAPRSR